MATKNSTASLRKVAPLQLVKDNISHDVVEILEELLDRARSGNITGIVVACAMPGMRYITDAGGDCVKYPTFTRGMVDYLSDQIATLVHQADRNGPR
ncbi:MAG: hypothetical protein Q7T21_15660 [Gallionella sp.]|nr:hypothetical protein [Gallionella sp.]